MKSQSSGVGQATPQIGPAAWLRDLVILASVPNAVTHELIAVSPCQVEKMTGQAALLGAAPAIRLADAIAAAVAGMQGNMAHRLVLELCCARALLACPSLKT